MAADAPDLTRITAAFTEAELELLERAADGRMLEDFLHRAVVKIARNLTGAGEASGDPRHHEADGAMHPTVGDAAAAALLERGERLERLLGEVVALATTILSELYAHTAFRDAAHERECRARAEEKIAKIAPSIQRLLAVRPMMG